MAILALKVGTIETIIKHRHGVGVTKEGTYFLFQDKDLLGPKNNYGAKPAYSLNGTVYAWARERKYDAIPHVVSISITYGFQSAFDAVRHALPVSDLDLTSEQLDLLLTLLDEAPEGALEMFLDWSTAWRNESDNFDDPDFHTVMKWLARPE